MINKDLTFILYNFKKGAYSMKNILLFGILVLGVSACSKTWSGIKQDSRELFVDTKEVIHNATAPSYIPPVQSIVRPVVSTTPVQQQMTAQPTVVSPVVSTNPVQVSAPTVMTPVVSTSSVNVSPATATPTSVVSYVPVKPIAK